MSWDTRGFSRPEAMKQPHKNDVLTFPGSPFRLHQPFDPAGDQPTAIAQLMEGLGDGTYASGW